METAEMRKAQNQSGYPRYLARLDPPQTAGFTDLFEPNLGPLKRYVAAALRYGPDVDDVVQQTALKAYVHRDQFRFEAQFGSWLRTIALNEIRQLHRQRSGLRTAESLSRDIADEQESPQTAWERKETAEAVHRAIGRLPAKLQTIITLRYLEFLDIAEIAERLSISIGAVKTRLHRARRQLAHELKM